MKAQQLLNTLPKEEIKAEIFKEIGRFAKLFVGPFLERIFMILLNSLLKRYDITPKDWKIMADIDPDPGTTPDPPQ